jgi:hypothetical protein
MLDNEGVCRPNRNGADTTGIGPDQKVSSMSRKELVESWADYYGHPPPLGISRRLLIHAAAYATQASAYGGLGHDTKRKIKLVAERSANRKSTGFPSKQSSLAVGSRLVREWQGNVHAVDVLDTGFLYKSSIYGSLSEVARVITGARWSGPRFFGTRQ